MVQPLLRQLGRAKKTRICRAIDESAIRRGTGLIVDRRTKVMGRRLSVSTLASRGANRDQVGQAAHAVAEDPCRPAAAAAMVAHDRHFLDRQALLLRSEQQLDIEAW